MIPTSHHAQLGALTPAGSRTSPLPGELLSAGEDACSRELLPRQRRFANVAGSFDSSTVLPNAAGFCKGFALPIICHYFLKHITMQVSCSPRGKHLLQEKKEPPSALNKIKGEQKNSHKLCRCFSAALGFPSPSSMEGKKTVWPLLCLVASRADPLKQPTHTAWGRASPAWQLNFSKVKLPNKKTTAKEKRK